MSYNLLQKVKGKTFFLFLFLSLFCFSQSFAQSNYKVTGRILDGANPSEGIIGATVVEKGTTNGVATDIDGNFTITVAGGDAVLVVSYVGYATQEVEVANQKNVTITLAEDSKELDEVVVVGYKTIKKSDLTGAVGSVGAEALTERNMTNALEAVQGNVAGVQISNSTGRLGDGFDITIRGNNSLNDDSNPLFVVDGVPVDNIDFLNPQDIARIDILKDASSTAIYGSRGSNGVVIVTTKSGNSVKPGLNVSLDSYYGVKQVARLPQMMDGQTWWRYHQSAYIATSGVADPMDLTAEVLESKYAGSANSLLVERANNNEYFDWYDLVLQNGNQHNTYLNFSGNAAGGVGYNIGLGVQNETGNVQNESLDKYTLKIGLHHKVSDRLTYGLNTTLALTNDQLGSELAMREAFRLNPFLSPYGLDGVTLEPQPGKLRDENGDYLINKTSTYNPLLEIANSTDEIRRLNGIGNAFIQYKPAEWLSFKSTFAPGFSTRRRGRAWGAQTNRGVSNNNLPSADLENIQNINYTWDNQFDVDRTYGDHKISLLGLQSIYYTQTEGNFMSARNLPFETDFYNLGSGEQSTYNVSSFFTKQTLASFALRFNYSFNDKYLVTLSNRWDGSSLLSEGNRWDNFPSAAVAWNISQEDFLSGVASVSYLKLRASYGFTGNNIIAPYSTANILNTQTYYDYYGSTANGWITNSLANNTLGWEKTREANFGLDFGFMNERVVGSLDIYDRLSDDLLLQQQLPIETGFESISANVGSVSNKGVELALTTRNIVKSDLSWQTTFTFTRNRNSIVSIYGQTEVDDIGNGWFIGESINSHYNYQFDGIWQASERDAAESYGQSEGQARVVDQNNDGVISADDDRIILGNSDPSWSGSVFSSLRYKDFDFSFSVIASQGMYVFSPFHQNFTDTRDRGRQKLDIDWYIPENGAGLPAQPSNSYPMPRNMGTYWRNDGVGYYRDASFIKVKNISLGYNLSKEALANVGISRMRIYANVLNPFVFTEYDGYDPEWASASFGIGRVSSITYQLGVNVNF